MSASASPRETLQGQVIAANQEFYRQIAVKYDEYEACASDGFYQDLMEADLETIARTLRKPPGVVRCLDCGGGTGNLTLKLLQRGWNVTVVDVSSDMLEILKAKISAANHHAKFVHDSVEAFLNDSPELFDVISFSSVLHHLYAPLEMVRLAARHIAPSGFFYSIFDPAIPSSRVAAASFAALDTLIAKLLHDRQDFLPGMIRRARKLFAAADGEHGRQVVSAGDLAEYHAARGIDDRAMEAALASAGFEVDRKRYPAGRSRAMRWLNRHLQAVPNFRILAHRRYSR